MKEVILKLQKANIDGWVVVGDPKYYSKFGFISASPLLHKGVYEKYFMKLEFNNDNKSDEVKFDPIHYNE